MSAPWLQNFFRDLHGHKVRNNLATMKVPNKNFFRGGEITLTSFLNKKLSPEKVCRYADNVEQKHDFRDVKKAAKLGCDRPSTNVLSRKNVKLFLLTFLKPSARKNHGIIANLCPNQKRESWAASMLYCAENVLQFALFRHLLLHCYKYSRAFVV